MITIEEHAEGIIQIVNRGAWTSDTWQAARHAIDQYVQLYTEPIYLLFNLTATTEIDRWIFESFIYSEVFNHENIGMAILVGRKAHLNLAREVLHNHTLERDAVQLRLMSRLDDAFRVLLDKQVLDRIQRAQQHGK